MKRNNKKHNFFSTMALCMAFTSVLFIFEGCQAQGTISKKTWFIDTESYQQQLALIQQKDSDAMNTYQNLIQQAQKQLDKDPYSVMHKITLPPSGSKHDYLSLAPYFWPNPDTPNGLPYIRKDGEVNPETRDDFTDYEEMGRFFNAVGTLGKAAYFSGDTVFANKVLKLIAVWFLDEETRMNPNLNYGQGIPGINDGRPFGIIEFTGIKNVITTLELLKLQGTLPSNTESGMKKWLLQYVLWLETSELGIMEKTRSNNHGTHYDGQLCAILFYLEEPEKVKQHLETVTKPRIDEQIEPDGSQPHELERTKAFSYSTMNLSGLTTLAEYGKKVNVDLWNYETEDGRSIKQAYRFLIPYIASNKEWDYPQITNESSYKERFAKLLLSAGKEFNEPEYVKIAEKFFASQKEN